MSKARELSQRAGVDGALSNRNLIINGAMQVAQRGTSSSSGGYSTVDRYYHNLSGATSTVTREEATLGQEVDGQFEYWLKVNTTTGNNYCGIQQRVENVRSLRQGKATLSFWVKGTNPASGQYLVQLQRLPAGPSGSTLDIPLNDTYTVSSTWTRKTFTFDVPALSTSVTENGNSQLYITLGAQEGSDTSTDAWELNITGVQLEIGDTATPFEHRSYGQELALCQRYYQVIPISDRVFCSYNNSSASYGGSFQWFVPMRAAPTAQGGTNAECYASDNSNQVTGRQVLIQSTYTTSAEAYLNYDTVGAHSWFVRADSIILDAEL